MAFSYQWQYSSKETQDRKRRYSRVGKKRLIIMRYEKGQQEATQMELGKKHQKPGSLYYRYKYINVLALSTWNVYVKHNKNCK